MGRLHRGFDLGLIDQLLVDFDPRDEQQACFETDARLARLVSFRVRELVDPEIAEAKPDQHFALGLDGLFASSDQMLRIGAGDLHIEATILDVVAGTAECGNIAGEEGITFPGPHFADAIEVAQTGDMQIEK